MNIHTSPTNRVLPNESSQILQTTITETPHSPFQFSSTASPLTTTATQHQQQLDEIQLALQGGKDTMIVDVRSMQEIVADKSWNLGGWARRCQWAHAPGISHDNPLLQVAAHALLPHSSTPVLIYSGSCSATKKKKKKNGTRTAADRARQVLNEQGYHNVWTVDHVSHLLWWHPAPTATIVSK